MDSSPKNILSQEKQRKLALNDFAFEVPEAQIAQKPTPNRENARLLLRKSNNEISHHLVHELPTLLNRRTLLVFNNTQVFPSRLVGQLETGGKIEIFLLQIPIGEKFAVGKVLGKPRRKLKMSTRIYFSEGVEAVVVGKSQHEFDLSLEVEFNCCAKVFSEWVQRHGYVPLPPYIKRSKEVSAQFSSDLERYQTVYAKNIGSVAAPTAGLHFTPKILMNLEENINVETCSITLHVGAGTFLPVKNQEISKHQMHSESFMVAKGALEKIEEARNNNFQIIAVGTTSFRCLESLYKKARQEKSNLFDFCDIWHQTDLFIHPQTSKSKYKSQVFDGIMTNFHQPSSTLFMLICSLLGYENAMSLYREAIKDNYRFYSYGDSSLLWF